MQRQIWRLEIVNSRRFLYGENWKCKVDAVRPGAPLNTEIFGPRANMELSPSHYSSYERSLFFSISRHFALSPQSAGERENEESKPLGRINLHNCVWGINTLSVVRIPKLIVGFGHVCAKGWYWSLSNLFFAHTAGKLLLLLRSVPNPNNKQRTQRRGRLFFIGPFTESWNIFLYVSK